MRNNYLRDRASRRMNSMRDGRNPYGSRGGYVSSRKTRGRDRAMDYEPYYPEHDSRMGRGRDREQYPSDYHYGGEHYGQSPRNMGYEMYGYGVGYPMHDYGMDMNYNRGGDYNDYGNDYAMEKEYEEKLDHWIKKLKARDRFHLEEQEVIKKAKEMGVRFEEFDEKEFYATYLMLVSDFKHFNPDPHAYIISAQEWLEDDDAKLKNSEKLCKYLYGIVLDEED